MESARLDVQVSFLGLMSCWKWCQDSSICGHGPPVTFSKIYMSDRQGVCKVTSAKLPLQLEMKALQSMASDSISFVRDLLLMVSIKWNS